MILSTVSGSSPSNRMATLSPRPASTWRSTQLYDTFSLPFRNHAMSPLQNVPDDTEVKGLNQLRWVNAI